MLCCCCPCLRGTARRVAVRQLQVIPHCAAAAHVAVAPLVMSPLGSCESRSGVLLLALPPPLPPRCSSCRHQMVAPCRAVLLLPVSPQHCSLCRRWAVASHPALCCCCLCRRQAVASCTAVCCCPHWRRHRHRHTARRVAVGQLRVMQWCAAAHTATATTVLVVSSLCGCHCHGGC